MCTRSLSKGEAAIASIEEAHSSTNINIDPLQLDLKDLTSVVRAAKHFLTLETALHGLVNNAGIMATPFEVTRDGYEAQWQTNYLSHWVFTTHLLPLLQRTAAAGSTLGDSGNVRIVNLTSSGHLAAPKPGIDFEDPSLKNSGGPWSRYGQSKLANILHTRTLHTLYGPGSGSARTGGGEIWVTCVHPGVVDTNLASSVGESGTGSSAMMGVFSLLRWVGLTWSDDKGSWNSLFCVAGQEMKAEESGGYVEIFGRFGEPKCLSKAAKDAELAERLEKWTREVMQTEGFLG